jgi:hypothetical protein
VKTISRSATRQIAELKEQLTDCRVYTLENQFIGKTVDPAFAWKALAANRSARLTDRENGTYTVHIHDNRWYELRAS